MSFSKHLEWVHRIWKKLQSINDDGCNFTAEKILKEHHILNLNMNVRESGKLQLSIITTLR